MSEKTFRLVTWGMLLLLGVVLIATSIKTLQRRQDICTSQNQGLNVLHDVIQLSLTPQPGQKITAVQAARIQRFEGEAFARINAAKC